MLTSEFIYDDNIFDNKTPSGNGGTTSLSYKVRIDGKQYFMKQLRPEFQDELRYRTLFYKEYDIGCSISNSHVAKYEKICEDKNGMYILMEYIYGSTIEEILNSNKVYFANEQNLWRFLLQLLDGIRCFHQLGIAYLDFSPNNIMLTQIGNNVKIIDLGFCFNNAYGHTAGTTKEFAPPEIEHINEIDERSDIYSIGCLMQYIQKKSEARYSRHFNSIAARCLKKEKEKRFASTDEMIRAIRRRNRQRNILLSIIPVTLTAIVLFAVFAGKETIDIATINGIEYRILSADERTCEVIGGNGDEWNIYIAGHATIDGKQYRTTQVAEEAFKGTSIKSAYLPEGIETISVHAFANCDSIVTIYIPSTVKNINGAFCGMKKLRSVRIPPEMAVIGNAAFVLCTSLNDIEVPEGVERIGLDAFAKCSSLKNIKLPQSLKAIERGVFWECTALQEITIPADVSEIGDYAFYNCTELKDVYNYAVEPQKITMIFNTPQVTVHVPTGSLDAYKKDLNWQKYNITGDL